MSTGSGAEVDSSGGSVADVGVVESRRSVIDEVNSRRAVVVAGVDLEKEESGWHRNMKALMAGMDKLKRLMLEQGEFTLSSREFTEEFFLYAIRMRDSKAPGELQGIGRWDGYKEQFFLYMSLLEDIAASVIIPAIEGKENAELLSILVEMWKKYHGVRFYLIAFLLPSNKRSALVLQLLRDMSMALICDSVFDLVWNKVVDAVIQMINQVDNQELWLHHHQRLLDETIKFSLEIGTLSRRPNYTKLVQLMHSHANTCSSSSSTANLARDEWLQSCATLFGDYLRKVEKDVKMEEKNSRRYLDDNGNLVGQKKW